MSIKSLLCHFFPHKFVEVGSPELCQSRRFVDNVCVAEGQSLRQEIECRRCGYRHARYTGV